MFNAYTWIVDTRNGIIRFGDLTDIIDKKIKEYDTLEKYFSVIHPDDYLANRLSIKDIIENGTNSNEEYIFTYRVDFNKQGNYEWWEMRVVSDSISGNGNEHVHFCLVLLILLQQHNLL